MSGWDKHQVPLSKWTCICCFLPSKFWVARAGCDAGQLSCALGLALPCPFCPPLPHAPPLALGILQQAWGPGSEPVALAQVMRHLADRAIMYTHAFLMLWGESRRLPSSAEHTLCCC